MLKFSIKALPSDDAESATFQFFVEGSSVVVECNRPWGSGERAEISHEDFAKMASFLASASGH